MIRFDTTKVEKIMNKYPKISLICLSNFPLLFVLLQLFRTVLLDFHRKLR